MKDVFWFSGLKSNLSKRSRDVMSHKRIEDG